MLGDFKDFIARGNVMDLAVGVIIGGAFALITKSLTDDLIMPFVSWIFGGLDFSSYFVRLSEIPEGYQGSVTNYAELKEAGVAMIGYGQFVSVFVNFIILAFIIFLLVRYFKRVQAQFEEKKEAAPAAPPEEVVLLREIRDSLKK